MLLRSFRLEAPRAANTKMIIGRAELAPQALPGRWEEAVEACRLTPPPIGPGRPSICARERGVERGGGTRPIGATRGLEQPEEDRGSAPGHERPEDGVRAVEAQARLRCRSVRFGDVQRADASGRPVRFGSETPSSWWPSSSGTSSKPCPLRLYTASPTRRFRLIARLWLGFVRCTGTSTAPGLSCNMEH